MNEMIKKDGLRVETTVCINGRIHGLAIVTTGDYDTDRQLARHLGYVIIETIYNDEARRRQDGKEG